MKKTTEFSQRACISIANILNDLSGFTIDPHPCISIISHRGLPGPSALQISYSQETNIKISFFIKSDLYISLLPIFEKADQLVFLVNRGIVDLAYEFDQVEIVAETNIEQSKSTIGKQRLDFNIKIGSESD